MFRDYENNTFSAEGVQLVTVIHILFLNIGPFYCWVLGGGKLFVYASVELNAEYVALFLSESSMLFACYPFATNY